MLPFLPFFSISCSPLCSLHLSIFLSLTQSFCLYLAICLCLLLHPHTYTNRTGPSKGRPRQAQAQGWHQMGNPPAHCRTRSKQGPAALSAGARTACSGDPPCLSHSCLISSTTGAAPVPTGALVLRKSARPTCRRKAQHQGHVRHSTRRGSLQRLWRLGGAPTPRPSQIKLINFYYRCPNN